MGSVTKCVLLLLGGIAFQWVWSLAVAYSLLVPYYATHIPFHFYSPFVVVANVPVCFAMCADWWRQRISKMMMLSIISNLLVAVSFAVICIGAGC